VVLGSCSEAVNYASCGVALASLALGRIDAVVLQSQNYWDFAAGFAILKEMNIPIGVWRESWRDRDGESLLSQAGPNDLFDIVAARDEMLFRELTQVIGSRRNSREASREGR